MTWQTHLLAGIGSLWLLEPFPAPLDGASTDLGMLALLACLGALLPDLDARESRLKHLRLETGGGGHVRPFLLPSLLLHQTFGHRGALHSLTGLAAAVLLLSLPLSLALGGSAGAALLLGYASHLAADACTPRGVPLLWPRLRRYHLLPATLRVTTGSLAEDVVRALLLLPVLLLLLSALLPAALSQAEGAPVRSIPPAVTHER